MKRISRTTLAAVLISAIAGAGLGAAAIATTHHGTPKGTSLRPAHSPTTATPPATTAQPGTTATTTPRPTVTDQPPLTAAQLKYDHFTWGDPKTDVGVVILAPKGWRMVKLSAFEVQFTSPNKLWNLRVNGAVTTAKAPGVSANEKIATLLGTPGFRVLSRVDGTTRSTNPNSPGMTFHHTTLTYSYAEPGGGNRVVVDRFVAVYEPTGTNVEISAGGRPQDQAALQAITTKATEDYIRLP